MIRQALPSDIDWLISQLRAFSHFFGTKKPLFGDEEQARESMLAVVQNHVVYVAENADKTLMGFIAGCLIPHPYNPKITVLSEAFWWVDELYRGTRAGLKLLNAFVAFGKAHADWITFTLEAKSPVNESCLLKRGFRLQERNYLMEVT